MHKAWFAGKLSRQNPEPSIDFLSWSHLLFHTVKKNFPLDPCLCLHNFFPIQAPCADQRPVAAVQVLPFGHVPRHSVPLQLLQSYPDFLWGTGRSSATSHSRWHMVLWWKNHHRAHTQQKALLCSHNSGMFVVPRWDEVVTVLLKKKNQKKEKAAIFIGRAVAYHTLAEWMGTCLLLLPGPWGDNSVLFTSSKKNFCFSSAGPITPAWVHGVHWPF